MLISHQKQTTNTTNTANSTKTINKKKYQLPLVKIVTQLSIDCGGLHVPKGLVLQPDANVLPDLVQLLLNSGVRLLESARRQLSQLKNIVSEVFIYIYIYIYKEEEKE